MDAAEPFRRVRVLGIMRIADLVAKSILGLACAGSSAAGTSSPVSVVTQLYQDFAWEAVMAPPHPAVFAHQPAPVLERYLTPGLAAALAADLACQAATLEICRLDFAPLWDSQDPSAQDLSIMEVEPTRVRVQYRYGPGGTKVTLEFQLASTSAG